jgi:hypothetical protein
MFTVSSSFAEIKLERIKDRDPFLDRGDRFGVIDADDIKDTLRRYGFKR